MQRIFQIKITSPLGILVVKSKDDEIVQLFLDSGSPAVDGFQNLEDLDLPDCLFQAKQQLNEYFSGKRKKFDLPFTLLGNTPNNKMLEELISVPYGKTISYGELAKKSGILNGARVAGHVMAKNLLPILIPCHRVIRKDGSIGEYSLGGSNNKKLLLELEGFPGSKEVL